MHQVALQWRKSCRKTASLSSGGALLLPIRPNSHVLVCLSSRLEEFPFPQRFRQLGLGLNQLGTETFPLHSTLHIRRALMQFGNQGIQLMLISRHADRVRWSNRSTLQEAKHGTHSADHLPTGISSTLLDGKALTQLQNTRTSGSRPPLW